MRLLPCEKQRQNAPSDRGSRLSPQAVHSHLRFANFLSATAHSHYGDIAFAPFAHINGRVLHSLLHQAANRRSSKSLSKSNIKPTSCGLGLWIVRSTWRRVLSLLRPKTGCSLNNALSLAPPVKRSMATRFCTSSNCGSSITVSSTSKRLAEGLSVPRKSLPKRQTNH